MVLEDYKNKRRFSSTPEPKGGDASSGKLLFVIQKHAASRLHYDLRLEVSGVLKSWAVPKGPSLNPRDKRLAMMVEDHPMDYATFEGKIPEGNYGAGTVMVWDYGSYYLMDKDPRLPELEQEVAGALAAGEIKIVFEGIKIRGKYVLVKTKAEENSWLLIKKEDEYVSEVLVIEQEHSVISARNLSEIKNKGRSLSLADAEKTKMPQRISPMLATLWDEPFTHKDWLFELKLDGYRILAKKEKGDVLLSSRKNLDLTSDYPAIAEALKKVNHDCVLDGELVVLDNKGRPSFQLMQKFKESSSGKLAYYVFDLLHLDGHDLTALPLLQRKYFLSRTLPRSENIFSTEFVFFEGDALFKAARNNGLEGIVGKQVDSVYETGKRSFAWRKVQAHKRQEVLICGFTEPGGGRKHFGSLVVGVHDNKGNLVFAGHVGGGFDEDSLKTVHKKMLSHVRKTRPFSIDPKTNGPVTWVEPKFVAEVRFREWTADGSMRQPIFLGLREDKEPEEVKKEVEVNVSPTIKISNQEKIFWPSLGYQKGKMLAYYEKIAPVILPYLRDRPEVLLRHPNGVRDESFHQKNIVDAPAWVKTHPIYSESSNRVVRYLVCNDKESLLYMANLGCIEIHPWNSRIGSLDKPDYCVIDLDPLEVEFEMVVFVANVVRQVLDNFKIEGYCRTSGATGLHVFIPFGGRYTYEQARDFAKVISIFVNKKTPNETSLERSPEKRRGRVYLDYLQNGEGKTMPAAYSLRATEDATVATPLLWEEVRSGLDPKDFTLDTVFKRLEEKGDLWKQVLHGAVDLGAILSNIQRNITGE